MKFISSPFLYVHTTQLPNNVTEIRRVFSKIIKITFCNLLVEVIVIFFLFFLLFYCDERFAALSFRYFCNVVDTDFHGKLEIILREV